MSKTKIVEKIVRFELFLTVIGQSCKSDQSLSFAKAAILREMTFANDCANCCFFRVKLMRKERKILCFVPQKFAKVLRMETLM